MTLKSLSSLKGKITIKGVDVREKRKVRQMISFLTQETMVDEIFTVKELLIAHSKIFGGSRKVLLEIAQRIGFSRLENFCR
jgi:ABC-type multidrug transport system ATPase subunit